MAEKKWFESVVPEGEVTPREIDTSVPHIARMYDYWLGGKDNISQGFPVTPVSAPLVSV